MRDNTLKSNSLTRQQIQIKKQQQPLNEREIIALLRSKIENPRLFFDISSSEIELFENEFQFIHNIFSVNCVPEEIKLLIDELTNNKIHIDPQILDSKLLISDPDFVQKTLVSSQILENFTSLLSNSWQSCHLLACFGNLKVIKAVFDRFDPKRIRSICALKTRSGTTLMHLAAHNKVSGAEIVAYFKEKLDHHAHTTFLVADNNQRSCYHYAMRFGALDIIKVLFDSFDMKDIKSIAALKTHSGATLFHLAAQNKDYGADILSYLREKIGNQTDGLLLETDTSLWSAYHEAVRSSNLAFIKVMFEYFEIDNIKSVCELKNFTGETLAHLAAQNKDSGDEILSYFKEKLGDQANIIFAKADNDQWSSYHHVTRLGNLACAKVLFDSLDVKDMELICKLKTRQGSTLLHLALKNKEFGTEILIFLLEKLSTHVGLLFQERDKDNWSYYHHVACYGNVSVIESLFKNANIEWIKSICLLKTLIGETLLHLAPRNKDHSVEMLTYLGAKLGNLAPPLLLDRDINQCTPYHHATRYANLATIKVLFEGLEEDEIKSICKIKNYYSETLLNLAAKNTDNGARIILYFQKKLGSQRDVLLEKVNYDQWSSYHYATYHGNLAVIKVLFDGLDTDHTRSICALKSRTGETLFHLAALNKDHGAEIISYFIDKLGAQASSVLLEENHRQWSTYHYAAYYNNLSFIKALFKNIDTDRIKTICQLKNDLRATLLHLAILNKNNGAEILSYLTGKLGEQARELLLQEANTDKWTCYFYAVRFGNLAVIKALFDSLNNDQITTICELQTLIGLPFLKLAAQNDYFRGEIMPYLTEKLGQERIHPHKESDTNSFKL